VRLRAMRSVTPTPAFIGPLNGGAACPVTLNGRSVPHHGSVVAERVEARLTVIGAHPAAADPAEWGGRRNHLGAKVIA
jgi:hypothetical protein